ncbi:MAG: hypothetical protein WBE13_04665 [Candidatus Acidiferrum sp.]
MRIIAGKYRCRIMKSLKGFALRLNSDRLYDAFVGCTKRTNL